MSSYTYPNQALVPSATDGEQKMKLYQAFIFSIPICFTFIVLFVFYVIYLRRRNSNVNWSSLGMRGGPGGNFDLTNNVSLIEIGISKELREMLPIVIFGESFTVKDPQCSVCLGDYQAGEKLQQIPACGHTFHMECIDLWLTSHSTCPLCRVSLIVKVPHQTSDTIPSMENSNARAPAEPESQPTTEAISHIDDGQEGNRDVREISKQMHENDQNNIGTSDGYSNCRLG